MLETLVNKEPALLIPILAVAGTALVFVVWIVAHHWRKVRQLEVEASLKKDMLAREFTPEDIERVLLASAVRAEEGETVSDNEYYLVEKMLDEEYPAEEIARVVRALKGGKEPVDQDEAVTR